MSNKIKFGLLSSALILAIGLISLVIAGAFSTPTSATNIQANIKPAQPSQNPENRKTVQISPIPTDTPLPTATPSPTPLPTATPTPTPIPTATPIPRVDFKQRFVFQKSDTVRYIKPGIIHVQRTMPGPIVVNFLLFDLTAPELSLRVALQNDWLSGVARTSALAKENNAIAAVNGDLFSYNGLPQGMTMTDGKLALAPKHRATFAYSQETGPFIGFFTEGFTWNSSVVSANGERHSLEIMNSICKEDWLCIYTDMYHQLPYGYDEVRVTFNAYNEVTAITQQQAVKIEPGSQVLSGRGTAGKWLLKNMKVGDKFDLNQVTDPDYHQFEQIVSGGPVFLRDGKFIQDCMCFLDDCSASEVKDLTCEEFTTEWKELHYHQVRMPRNGIGYNDDKSVLMVAVADGYAPGHSIGITQKEFAELFSEFDITTAMELDGGGSATMYVNNKLVSRPSDGNGYIERAVPNAVVFNWNDWSEYGSGRDPEVKPSGR
jgi:hypothetical protein